MSTPDQLPSPAVERTPLRLTLSPASVRHRLDGTWWLQSDDLDREIADLVDHFPGERGQVGHVTYPHNVWRSASRRVQCRGRWVKTGWFEHMDADEMIVRVGDTLLRILVMPSQTPAAVAKRSTAMVANPVRPLAGSQVMAASDDRHGEPKNGTDAAAYAHWDDDGGLGSMTG